VVLDAARRLLVDEGSEAVTPLRISEMTGVARTTIYRHWPDREQLLLETLAAEEPDHPSSRTGNLREDLITFLEHVARRIGRRPMAPLLAAMAERAQRDPETASLQRDRLEHRMEPLREILEAGIETGELPGNLDVGATVARLAGPLFYQRLIARGAAGRELITSLVDTFLAAPTAR